MSDRNPKCTSKDNPATNAQSVTIGEAFIKDPNTCIKSKIYQALLARSLKNSGLYTSTPFSTKKSNTKVMAVFKKTLDNTNPFHAVFDNDSGYGSTRGSSMHESNFDSSSENALEDSKHVGYSQPVFLNEDALLEKPESAKINLSAEIEKEDFEETRMFFNSFNSSNSELGDSFKGFNDSLSLSRPFCGSESVFGGAYDPSKLFNSSDSIVSNSFTSEVSKLSGFDTDISDTSMVIPICEDIIVKLDNLPEIKQEQVMTPKEENLQTIDYSSKKSGYISGDAINNTEIVQIYNNYFEKANAAIVTDKSRNAEEIVTLETKQEQIRDNNDSSLEKSTYTVTDSHDEVINTEEIKELFSSGIEEINHQDIKIEIEDLKKANHVDDMEIEIADVKMEEPQNNVKIYIEDSMEVDHVEGMKIEIEDVKIEEPQSTVNIEIGDLKKVNHVVDMEIKIEDVKIQEPQNTLMKTVLCDVTNTCNSVDSKISKHQEIDAAKYESPVKRLKTTKTYVPSPDLFSDAEEPEAVYEPPPEKKPFTEKYVFKSDTKLLKRVQNGMSGVLPPPCFTLVNLSVDEILTKINEGSQYLWHNADVGSTACTDANVSSSSMNTSGENSQKTLLINGPHKNKDKKWPEVLGCRNLGLHHNRGKVSEDFEHLCDKYAQRYVGLETKSTCTVFETNYFSPKKKLVRPRWAVKSPGRRLSHLARRRITFTSANLQASNNSFIGSRTRQIMIDAKKLELLSRRKSPKKTPKKSPVRSPIKSRTPSSSAKKKLLMRFRLVNEEIEESYSNCSSVKSDKSWVQDETSREFIMSSMEEQKAKRKLFSSSLDIFSKKRKRDESTESSQLSKLAKYNMKPTKEEMKSAMLNLNKTDTTAKPSQSIEITEVYKKKLQWTVYESLRSQNVTPTRPEFKTFASTLARVIRRFLPSSSADKPEELSYKMMKLARLNVFAVIKGKTVDEIISDYMKTRQKQESTQGTSRNLNMLGGLKNSSTPSTSKISSSPSSSRSMNPSTSRGIISSTSRSSIQTTTRNFIPGSSRSVLIQSSWRSASDSKSSVSSSSSNKENVFRSKSPSSCRSQSSFKDKTFVDTRLNRIRKAINFGEDNR